MPGNRKNGDRMKINIIRIGNFGRFSAKELSFGDGLNIVRGDNEA